MVLCEKGRNRARIVGARASAAWPKLLARVIDYAKTYNELPAKAQDEQFATKAPSLQPH